MVDSNQHTSEDKPSAQKLLNTINRDIQKAEEPIFLTYNDIDPSAGSLIIESLDQTGAIENILPRYVVNEVSTPTLLCCLSIPANHEYFLKRLSYNSLTQTLTANVLPTFIHDCHQRWLTKEFTRMVTSGFLTASEHKRIDLTTGTSELTSIYPLLACRARAT